MIIVLDLDDTCYSEITFVKSGLMYLSKFLEKNFSIPQKQSMEFFNHQLPSGRENIIDILLLKHNILSRKLVKKCVSVYRQHVPDIILFSDTKRFLKKFERYPKYIVTDGNLTAQRNKVKALNLSEQIKFCYFTNRYGKIHTKPSPYCFLDICKRENVSPDEVIYIGDDPNKDFVNLKPLGFRTIRILRGRFKNILKPRKFEADFQIRNFDQLTLKYLKNNFPDLNS